MNMVADAINTVKITVPGIIVVVQEEAETTGAAVVAEAVTTGITTTGILKRGIKENTAFENKFNQVIKTWCCKLHQVFYLRLFNYKGFISQVIMNF
jgi:hypothetical protein